MGLVLKHSFFRGGWWWHWFQNMFWPARCFHFFKKKKLNNYCYKKNYWDFWSITSINFSMISFLSISLESLPAKTSTIFTLRTNSNKNVSSNISSSNIFASLVANVIYFVIILSQNSSVSLSFIFEKSTISESVLTSTAIISLT